MLTFKWLFTIAGIAALVASPAIARADAPKGTLVYNFTYSANQTTSARDSANPAEDYGSAGSNGGNAASGQTSGISTYNGSLSDKGTMTVDVLSQQQDGGLVVNISEAGEQTRRAPPATCVVYGNTRVICDPNKTVYTEEFTLLRFLGTNFVDPNNLDANKHWAIAQPSASINVTADYVINSNSNGQMQIGENRKVHQLGGGSLTTDIQSKIGYDFNRAIPTSVDEYVTQRHDNGVQGTSTTIYQTTLNLVSDSMAKT